MGFLGALGGPGVHLGFGWQVVFAISGLDVFPHLFQCGTGHLSGVRPHVGDQADLAFTPNTEAFVQLLGYGHGALGRKPQFAARFLLHGAGGERRGRPLPDIPLFYFSDFIVGIGQFRLVTPGIFFIGDTDSGTITLHRMQ